MVYTPPPGWERAAASAFPEGRLSASQAAFVHARSGAVLALMSTLDASMRVELWWYEVHHADGRRSIGPHGAFAGAVPFRWAETEIASAQRTA